MTLKKIYILSVITIITLFTVSGCRDNNNFAKIRLPHLGDIFSSSDEKNDKNSTDENNTDENITGENGKVNENNETEEAKKEKTFDNTIVLLSLNSTGENVIDLQKKLNNIVDTEYYLKENGKYDKNTEDTIKSFKSKYDFLKQESGDFNGDYTENTKVALLKEIDKRKVSIPNLLSLANKYYFLPSNYVPNDLVLPNVKHALNKDQTYMRKEAASALEELFEKAKEEDIILYVRTAYRSYKTQKRIFDGRINNGETPIDVNKTSARPGQSEHQLGLAVDITSQSVGNGLTEHFGKTKEGIWVKEHAHEFGFIIRYTEDKVHITGYSYEPWHLRYVGKEAAKEIYENGLVLEEYIDLKNKK